MESPPQCPSALYGALEARGVSRRDFVRFCGSIAVLVGLSPTAAPAIADALESAAAGPLKPALWLSQGLCTGCTESAAQSTYPDVGRIVLDVLSVNYWETLAAGAGASVESAAARTVADHPGKFILIVEGAIMRGFGGNALRIAGRPAIDDLKAVAAAAEAIVAVGSCAVDGGWVKATPNPADAVGVMDFLGRDKVVNLPTCPVNPEWLVAVLVDYLLLGKAPTLDAELRPTLIFSQTIHDNCPRRGHFENDEFVESFGSTEEQRNFCLYKMGCKGPQTRAQCPLVRWNSRVSWCVEAGSPCIGCANFDWVDRDAPFLQRMPDVLGVSPQTVGVIAGAAALTGLAAHGIAQTVTKRMGRGAPVEPPPERPTDADDQPATAVADAPRTGEPARRARSEDDVTEGRDAGEGPRPAAQEPNPRAESRETARPSPLAGDTDPEASPGRHRWGARRGDDPDSRSASDGGSTGGDR